ncbi:MULTISPECIES: methyl-accepting chemotaxis protein [Cohnella]|uniref:Methyl-accepting chemotaxis protein n=1 Tax=Cohnella phaseoli TaxID=456490 RepID=A0A3D9JNC2_9BACL|nr:methyl-accepting chemotaxis protein [Cohnella phaseoli]RED75504.1 methyl-accepting chemotaxis protein [Cohnella phaseoli]
MAERRRFWSYLRVQVILLMIVVLMLPLGGVGWFYYKTLSSDLGEIERAHALEVSASAHRLFVQLGEQLSGSVITNAKWKDYVDAINGEDLGWIEENINVSPDIVPNVSFVATFDYEGKVLSQAGDIPEFTGQLADRSIVEKVKAIPDAYGMIQTSEGLAVIAVSQITDEQGVAKSPAALLFGRLLDDEAVKGIGAILNAGISVRSSTDQRLSSLPDAERDRAEAALPGVDEQPRFATTESEGKRNSVVVSGYPGMSGEAIAELSVIVPAEASGTVHKEMVRMSLIVAVLAGLLIALIAYLLRWRMILPLVAFEAFLKEVSSGRLSVSVSDKTRRREDEIGSIGRSLQEMAEHLKTLAAGIRSTASATSSAVGQLTGEAEGAAEGANRIAQAMREVAAGADSQMQGMKRGADVALEIVAGMGTIGERSSAVAAVAEEASRQAAEGSDTVVDAVEQMDKISATVESSVRDARELHSKSERIERMAEAISAIAYRTNLLALNANIEASRAGEHGRGFAVVAGEVRKLAQQADQTASEITAIIAEVQGGILSVVRHIEAGQTEVSSGAVKVREADQTFRGIAVGIRGMEDELQGIAAAGQQIGAQLEELSALIEQTEAISASSAERAQDVADIAESQMNSVRKVADETNALASRIRELEQAVNRFR